MFSCEFCEISKNTFFKEHLWAIASWFLTTKYILSILLNQIYLTIIKKEYSLKCRDVVQSHAGLRNQLE